MKKWEQERIIKRGDGVPFYHLAQDFEEYFEGLREFAGEPAPGTTGRVLPKYQLEWLQAFAEVVRMRNVWWDGERRKAEAEIDTGNKPIEGKL